MFGSFSHEFFPLIAMKSFIFFRFFFLKDKLNEAVYGKTRTTSELEFWRRDIEVNFLCLAFFIFVTCVLYVLLHRLLLKMKNYDQLTDIFYRIEHIIYLGWSCLGFFQLLKLVA